MTADAPRDHGIIFSRPLVLSLLSGAKTMTRRMAWGAPDQAITSKAVVSPSPWQDVHAGDRLWVKEAIRFNDAHTEFFYDADGQRLSELVTRHLRAREVERGSPYKNLGGRYIPRAASRITLQVTATKIEHVQSISDDDAIAEGVERVVTGPTARGNRYRVYGKEAANVVTSSPRESFASLWRWLHGDAAWDADPEVVALSFLPVGGAGRP